MAQDDPYWQAAAAHVASLGLPASAVFASIGFEDLLPGCRTIASPSGADAPLVLVLHKGRLDQVPSAILLRALDTHTASFANEVFMVLVDGGEPVASDCPHVMMREALLVAALKAHEHRVDAPVPTPPSRMPATYVGQGRVLLESAFGHLMLVNGGDTAIIPHLIRDGLFDRNLTQIIGSLLGPGMTFIDIGANFGTYTLLGAEKVGPQGRVIAIEASPAIVALLNETVLMNGFEKRCEVLRCAAGAVQGKQLLHQFATRQGSNTMLPAIADLARAEYGETIAVSEVECRTLDSIVAERALERIDCIKIDVEGFEHDVLSGARSALLRYRPKLVLEWHNGFFVGREQVAHSLYNLLAVELGYKLNRIEPGEKTRPVTFDDLKQHAHSDLVAEAAA